MCVCLRRKIFLNTLSSFVFISYTHIYLYIYILVSYFFLPIYRPLLRSVTENRHTHQLLNEANTERKATVKIKIKIIIQKPLNKTWIFGPGGATLVEKQAVSGLSPLSSSRGVAVMTFNRSRHLNLVTFVLYPFSKSRRRSRVPM